MWGGGGNLCGLCLKDIKSSQVCLSCAFSRFSSLVILEDVKTGTEEPIGIVKRFCRRAPCFPPLIHDDCRFVWVDTLSLYAF